MKKLLTVSFALITATGLAGCQSDTAGTNTNSMNANVAVNLDPANLPPGLSAQPIQPSANTTPGIPAPGEANKVPVGTTPTPGIPDPKTLNKPMKPGLTPTPGIPDPETLRRQMSQPANMPPPANRPPGGVSDGGPNTVRKP